MTLPSGPRTLEVEWKTPLLEVKEVVPPVVPEGPSSENLLSSLLPEGWLVECLVMTLPSGPRTLEVEWKTPLFVVKVEVVPPVGPSSSLNLLSILLPVTVVPGPLTNVAPPNLLSSPGNSQTFMKIPSNFQRK
jgi:hypothetical protein